MEQILVIIVDGVWWGILDSQIKEASEMFVQTHLERVEEAEGGNCTTSLKYIWKHGKDTF